MATKLYSCPCCGAPLAWKDGKLECASCANAYEPEQIDEMNQPGESRISFMQAGDSYGRNNAQGMSAYTCRNCGAELVTEATTTATECPYCGSPTILPAQLDNGVKPEWVIPFRITKEQAQKAFEGYFKGKKLMPNIFLNSRNRIAEMKKVYVPYWLFDCAADAAFTYEAEKVYTRREGDWEVTTTEHYVLRRAGSMEFEHIPVDSSCKMNDEICESLEPYDLEDAIAFQPAVLAGALADHADAGEVECEKRAIERVERSVEDTFRQTTGAYENVQVRSRSIFSRDGVATPALMPVWIISTEKIDQGEKKIYTFAINGQTGELTCDVKPDPGKSWAWFGGIFVGVGAAGYALLSVLSILGVAAGDGWWLAILALALIAAFAAVSSMRAQLKTAQKKAGAGNYIREGSLNLTVDDDCFLYRTESRREIEQKKEG